MISTNNNILGQPIATLIALNDREFFVIKLIKIFDLHINKLEDALNAGLSLRVYLSRALNEKFHHLLIFNVGPLHPPLHYTIFRSILHI